MSSTPDDFDPAEIPQFPPTDESGNVDLTLVDECLMRTPSERLKACEELAQFIQTVRELNGTVPRDPQAIR